MGYDTFANVCQHFNQAECVLRYDFYKTSWLMNEKFPSTGFFELAFGLTGLSISQKASPSRYSPDINWQRQIYSRHSRLTRCSVVCRVACTTHSQHSRIMTHYLKGIVSNWSQQTIDRTLHTHFILLLALPCTPKHNPYAYYLYLLPGFIRSTSLQHAALGDKMIEQRRMSSDYQISWIHADVAAQYLPKNSKTYLNRDARFYFA